MKTASLVSVLLCLAVRSPAQMLPDNPGADSLIHAFLPVISYSSNEGLTAGAIYNRYDYRGDARPFLNYAESSALISTKGFIEVEGTYERTRTFGRKIRSKTDLFFRRYTTDNYFGTGNGTGFNRELWEEEYYYFESIAFGFGFRVRSPLHDEEDRRFDITGGTGVEYHIPYASGGQTSFAAETPNGNSGGWMSYLSTGFVWENRDSEFDPARGNRAEFEVRYAPAPVNEFALTTVRLQLRQYFQLFNRLKLANRLEMRHAGGDVPYWELSKLGDDQTLRGYPLNRFQGRSSLAYTLELRSWLLEFPEYYGLKLGGHLFTDCGRVFGPGDDFGDLFGGYKQTVGAGGALSMFSPDFILRGSIGFSEDLVRVYIGVGYMF